jgi:hypothetical protein
MQMASEVKNYLGACERLISHLTLNRQLSEDEARMIEFYCKELLAKIAPRLLKS